MKKELIIDDDNWKKFVKPPKDKGMGLIPRDYKKFPVGIYKSAKPFMLPLIPKEQWEERLNIQKDAQAQLSDIRNIGADGKPIPPLDQGQQGYCWAHSTVMCNMIVRAVQNLKYVALSAYAVACMIKNYKDEGGWCQQSLEFMTEQGVPSQEYWPQGNKSPSNDNPETWANAKLHIITEWQDHGQNNLEQLITCLLCGIPVATDYQWWGHSVCTLDLVSIKPLRTRIINSWGESWGEGGLGILEGKKCIPTGACSPRVIIAAGE